MNARGIAVAVALTCTVVASPSLAGPLVHPPNSIVFSGSGPATTTFTLREKTRLDFGAASITTRGGFGGVLILPEGRYGPHWGVLATHLNPVPLPLVGAHGSNLSPRDGSFRSYWPLPPGRYRAYLFADAPVEVRLPVVEGRPQAVFATQRTRPQGVHVEDHVVPPGPAAFELDHPFSRPVDGFDMVLAQFEPTYAERPSLELDLRRADPPQWGWTIRAGASANITMAQDMGPDRLYAGDWQATVRFGSPLTVGVHVRFAHFHADFTPAF